MNISNSKFIFLSMFICVNLWLFSIVIEIKQDGSGDYTEIQSGINSASEGDTVLVFPGTYYENVVINCDSLTLASCFILQEESNFINQTTINGNEEGSCIYVNNRENISIIGFSLTNGIGSVINNHRYGGGVAFRESSGLIKKCAIFENVASRGGGILNLNSDLHLTGNSIHHNSAKVKGGGLFAIRIDQTLTFDSEEKNSIYHNFGSMGADISFGLDPYTEIILDTFTVAEPDYFYLYSLGEYGLSIDNSYITPVEHDMYVAPDGDDDNSGLTPEDPLQSIFKAQIMIKSDSLANHIIHLAAGTYSPSLNNQSFVLGMKNHVPLIGESTETTILNAELKSGFFFQYLTDVVKNITIKNLSFINSLGESGGCIYSKGKNNFLMENVTIINSRSTTSSVMHAYQGRFVFNNVKTYNTRGMYNIEIWGWFQDLNDWFDVTMTNCDFSYNTPYIGFAEGNNIRFGGFDDTGGDYRADMINCITSNNYSIYHNQNFGGMVGVSMKKLASGRMVNCTITDNSTQFEIGSCLSIKNTNAEIYNTLIYNNPNTKVSIFYNSDVTFHNCLIEGGDEGIVLYYNSPTYSWVGENLDTDPLFDTDNEEHPYSLSADSPCIDAGTLALPPDIELPEYDLAGNPRIVGESIDIGAYEYYDNSIIEEDPIPLTVFQMYNYPNPFNPDTRIYYEVPEEGHVMLEIFNIKGQKIITLADAQTYPGKFEAVWRGKDSSNKLVASGHYFAKLSLNDIEKAIIKLTLLK